MKLRREWIFRLNGVFVKGYLSKCFPIICNELLYGVGQMLINIVIGHQNESAISAMIWNLPFLLVFSFVYTDEIIRLVILGRYMIQGKWIKPVTPPYKIAILYECKHSQKAILHGSE